MKGLTQMKNLMVAHIVRKGSDITRLQRNMKGFTLVKKPLHVNIVAKNSQVQVI